LEINVDEEKQGWRMRELNGSSFESGSLKRKDPLVSL